MTERPQVHEIDDDEGRRLVRIVRRGSGPVVTWRRAQTVLLPAQGMDAAVSAFTPADYEQYGPGHREHYLHGYHGAVPPVALIA